MASDVSERTRTENPFSEVISEVQKAPKDQRLDRLLDGIAAQMQQSNIGQTQQLGEKLVTAKPSLIRAYQQPQQGG